MSVYWFDPDTYDNAYNPHTIAPQKMYINMYKRTQMGKAASIALLLKLFLDTNRDICFCNFNYST